MQKRSKTIVLNVKQRKKTGLLVCKWRKRDGSAFYFFLIYNHLRQKNVSGIHKNALNINILERTIQTLTYLLWHERWFSVKATYTLMEHAAPLDYLDSLIFTSLKWMNQWDRCILWISFIMIKLLFHHDNISQVTMVQFHIQNFIISTSTIDIYILYILNINNIHLPFT
jgi:hypothetical protein